jgi:DNA mismatch repair ATPase MutS
MPVDGIALLGAVVKHFAQRGGAALFVLHFTEILHDAVLSSAVMQKVSCFRMETLQQTSPSQEDEGECYRERTPLFTLKKGVATSSEGIPCARSAGVSEDVLRRAAEVKRLVSSRQAIQPEGSRSRSIVQNPRNVELLALFLKTQNWAGDEGAANLEKFKDLL